MMKLLAILISYDFKDFFMISIDLVKENWVGFLGLQKFITPKYLKYFLSFSRIF